MAKWWEKYQKSQEGKLVLESVAKKYWGMYQKIIKNSDQKWIKACNGHYVPKKMVKEDRELDTAHRLAQPLLEEWVEICRVLQKTIR